jgi:hypothetical protein
MRLLSALLLLITTSLAAQTVDTTEQTYGPFAPGPDSSMAVAAAPQGLLLAWSEVEPATGRARIHTGLLGFDGRLMGGIHVLPALDESRDAIEPAVTTDYDRFFIAWRERTPGDDRSQRQAGMILSREGAAFGELYDFGGAVEGSPAILWDGLVFRVYGGETFKVRPDGAVSRTRGQAPRRVPFATPDMNGWVDWDTNDRRCNPVVWFCNPLDYYRLNWSILSATGTRTGSLTQWGYTGGAPAVVADGKNLLIVWSTERGLAGQRLSARSREGDPFNLRSTLAARSTVAMAGTLAVFESGGNIYGTVVAEESFGTPFPISADGEWDTRPGIQLVGKDRYLVTYIREHAPGSVTLVGRFVSLAP